MQSFSSLIRVFGGSMTAAWGCKHFAVCAGHLELFSVHKNPHDR